MTVDGTGQELPRSTPEQQGVPSAAILAFVDALETQGCEMHSLMLLRHGRVIAEGWWSPYAAQHPHLMFSLSKSFTATAVGLAINDGHFALDDPVRTFFPDEASDVDDPHLASLRVRDLLTMSTGHAEDTWAHMTARADGDWIRAFFCVPLVHPPGTHFLYNTGATFMLSAIMQRATGQKLVDYLRPRLFAPLGIEPATWDESPQGINSGGIGLSVTTEAIARFGQLYLQGGVWQGQRILPEAWVAQATAAQIASGEDPVSDWAQGYGYQFWRCRHGAYRGDGVFGQYCIVMPEQDAVLAMTGGLDVFDMQRPLDLLWETLLPVMDAHPLPDDAAAQRSLAAKLADLALPPAAGHSDSPRSAEVSGRTYRMDANALGIDSVTLDFAEAGCTLTVRTGATDEMITCGRGAWAMGRSALFANAPQAIAVSGAWTAEDTFTMAVRLVETPFCHTVDFHFTGDDLLMETRVNVSLESQAPVLLTAQGA